MNFINESGVYSLILRSKLPNAKAFKRWVTSEVLLSLRKHGAYITPQTLKRSLSDPEFIKELVKTLEEETDKADDMREGRKHIEVMPISRRGFSQNLYSLRAKSDGNNIKKGREND